jgi:hypothetical protein
MDIACIRTNRLSREHPLEDPSPHSRLSLDLRATGGHCRFVVQDFARVIIGHLLELPMLMNWKLTSFGLLSQV